MITMYGITNCDTVKKARRWMAEHEIEYSFHDFRKDGVSETLLRHWCAQLGYETLLNRRGTTWRKLPEDVKQSIDKDRAVDVMRDNPSIIKRPVLDIDGALTVGFSANRYAELFDAAS